MKVLLVLLLVVAVTACSEPSTPASPAPAVSIAPATPTDQARDAKARVAYDGGYLVADDRWFEGTIGLRFERHGRVVGSWCSSGAPIRSGDLVAWVTLLCPESGDIAATVLHRAGVDGSNRIDQRLPRRRNTSGSVHLLRIRGDDLVYRSIDGVVWATDLVAPPRRIRGR